MGATQGIGDYFKLVKNKNLLELRRALAHATFNGAMRFAQGGKFEHGFMSGFVSSLGGSFMQANAGNMSLGAKVTMSAVIGGTAEKLGGGKFANGAVTGAYVMMFNHLMEHGNDRPFGQGEELMPNGKNMPNELDYKNREVVTANGTEYILYDNQWHELLPNESYNFFMEDSSHPQGGIWITRSREEIAITSYQVKMGIRGGLVGTGVGGAVSWYEVANGLYRTNPMSILIGYGSGAFISLRRMEIRMMDHDRHVEHNR